MNIYDYITSRDVAVHCERIRHEFSSLEMAVIVAISKRSIKEKIAGWREIIADYPDMAIPESNIFGAKESLHTYLRERIAKEENGSPTTALDDISDIFIHIPVPFEKGDLLEANGIPYVLNYLPHWDTRKEQNIWLDYERMLSGMASGIDMIPEFYFFQDDGNLQCDHGPPFYYELCYWKGELKGRERFLEYLSYSIKSGEIDVAWLIAVHNMFKAEDDYVRGHYIPLEELLKENILFEDYNVKYIIDDSKIPWKINVIINDKSSYFSMRGIFINGVIEEELKEKVEAWIKDNQDEIKERGLRIIRDRA